MNRVQTFMVQFFASGLNDNGGRRTGVDRRYFSYSNHIPERRYIIERRSFSERRSCIDRRGDCSDLSVDMNIRVAEMDRRVAWNSAVLK
jgi:hypothetical protein